MAKRIIIPDEELHNIADAINNRADYLDEVNGDTSNRDSLVETEDRQMLSANMAQNILRLKVNLSRYYTKEEIDEMFANNSVRIIYVLHELDDVPAEDRDERTLYLKKLASYDNRYTIWVWHNEQWQIIGGNVVQEDLLDYYTQSEIDTIADSKQDKLTPGDGIQISEDGIISINNERGFKFVASLEDEQGGLFQATFQQVSNPDGDPSFAILAQDPLYTTLDENDHGYVVINLNPDNLVGSSEIDPADSSNKVATTQYVSEKLDAEYAKYIVFENSEEEEQVEKTPDTIYYNKETNAVYFGTQMLAGVTWIVLDEQSEPVYVEFDSGFEDLDPVVDAMSSSGSDDIPNYTNKFFDPWQGEQDIDWVAQNASDPTQSMIIPANTGLSIPTVLEELNITGYGNYENPAMLFTPVMPFPDNVHNYGYSANLGYFVQKIANSEQYMIYHPSDEYDPDSVEYSTLGSTINQRSHTDVYYPGKSFAGWCTKADGYILTTEDPQDVGFKVNPSKIDWSWTGTIYALWNELEYIDFDEFSESYMNDPCFQYTSSTDPKLQIDLSDVYEDLNVRYTIMPIVTYDEDQGWQLEPDFEDLSYVRNAPMIRFINNIKDIADDIAEYDEEIEFTPGTDSISLDVPQNQIFCIYVQEYSGTGDNIEIENTRYYILKGWSQNIELQF